MKTFAQIWGECKFLTRLECRVVMLHHDRMPSELAECDHQTAFFLYIADMLRFEKMDTNVILCFLRHFKEHLGKVADLFQENFERRASDIRSYHLAVIDGRIARITGAQSFLDLETGDELHVFGSPSMRTVSYNLSTLMLRRWADSVSPRLNNPEKPDGTSGSPEGTPTGG